MAIIPSPGTLFPPSINYQLTLSGSAQQLTALIAAVNAAFTKYQNRGGVQIKVISTAGSSAFWNTTQASCTTGAGDEIAAGTAQLVSPAQAKDTDGIWLVGNGVVVMVCFIGG
jgi:hypothetical protein